MTFIADAAEFGYLLFGITVMRGRTDNQFAYAGEQHLCFERTLARVAELVDAADSLGPRRGNAAVHQESNSGKPSGPWPLVIPS